MVNKLHSSTNYRIDSSFRIYTLKTICLQFPSSGIPSGPESPFVFCLLGIWSISATWHVINSYRYGSTDYTVQSHHGKIIVAHHMNKRHAYEIRRFLPVLTTARHWTPFCATQIQSIPQHISSLRFLPSRRPARLLSWFRNRKYFFVNRYKLWKPLIT